MSEHGESKLRKMGSLGLGRIEPLDATWTCQLCGREIPETELTCPSCELENRVKHGDNLSGVALPALDRERRYLNLAFHVATWSKDRSRQTGCVIVGPDNEIRSIGYNGFPRGVYDDTGERHERPAKYLWTEHAERNAIYNAARVGTPLRGCRLYLPWYPCADCARAIIQAGLAELICVRPDWNDPYWREHFAVVPQMLLEGGVVVRFVIL